MPHDATVFAFEAGRGLFAVCGVAGIATVAVGGKVAVRAFLTLIRTCTVRISANDALAFFGRTPAFFLARWEFLTVCVCLAEWAALTLIRPAVSLF